VTVVLIGANDGFAMGTASGTMVRCCDAPWIAEYARRARRMMATYLRRGSGVVYWVLLPAPRPPPLVGVFAAVNAGIRLAAGAFADGVRLIDLGSVLAPNGQFEEQITYHGRPGVVVRDPDGIHLTGAGAAIATTLIARALRSDGLADR
jgi:hypothetical protein